MAQTIQPGIGAVKEKRAASSFLFRFGVERHIGDAWTQPTFFASEAEATWRKCETSFSPYDSWDK